MFVPFDHRMKLVLSLISAALLVGGCASRINLNEVPVEDRSSTSVTAGADGAVPSGTPGSIGSAEGVPLSVIPADAPADERARSVYFDYDSAVVKPEFAPLLARFSDYLKANRQRKLTVEGHTDERGGREYNLALGQRRAEAVRRSLLLSGAEPGQIEAVSFGKEKLAAAGADEPANAKNRRAEINP